MDTVALRLADHVLDAEQHCPRRGKNCPILFFMGTPSEPLRYGKYAEVREACFRGIIIGEMCRKECPRLGPLERLSTYLHALTG